MGGIVYFEEQRPWTGTEVIIVVDPANKPTGIWKGRLLALSTTGGEPTSRDPNVLWENCTAHITDTRAPEEYIGKEPYLNYEVYIATAGTGVLLQRLDHANAEIKGLKKHIEIERKALHAAMRAMVGDEPFERLEKLLKEFLAKLGR